MNKYKVVFAPSTHQVATSKRKPGLYLEEALFDFVIEKNLATNPSGDCITLIPVGGGSAVLTNLGVTRTGTTNVINNSNGSGFTLQLASGIEAGLESPANFTKTGFLTVTAATDLDFIRLNVPLKQDKIQFQSQGTNLGGTDVTTINLTGAGVTGSRSGNVVTYNISGVSSGSGLTDGDKGDIVVSASGTTWTVDTAAISNTKMENMPANTVKVRNFATAGVPIDLVLNLNQLLGRGSSGNVTTINLGTNLSMSGNTLNATPAAASSAENGITGNGSVGTPFKLGGFLTGNTGLNASNFDLLIVNAGIGQLHSNTLASSVTSEVVVNAAADISAYLKSTNKLDSNKFAQLSLAHAFRMGLTYQVNTGQEVGFTIDASPSTVNSKLRLRTPNVALGTAVTGQVPTLQSDGTIEYQTNAGSVTRVSVTPLAGTGKCTFTYTGATAPTFTRNTASVWTINVPAGTELLAADIYSPSAANPGSNVTLNINTSSTIYNQDISTVLIPIFSGVALSGGTGSYALTTGTPNLQPSISVPPANGDIQFLINNYNTAAGLGSGDSILKLTF
jgi:hypothetical protein